MAYDYREALRNDIKEYINDNFEYIEENVDEPYQNRDEVEQFLYDELFVNDDVTGNASGSYTFDRAQAREYVEDNMKSAVEAYREFDCIDKFADAITENNYEAIDVTIRCYLLGEVLGEVLDTIYREYEERG